MMQNLYRRNPAKLHAWLAASRVERSPKHNKDAGNAADGTTPAVRSSSTILSKSLVKSSIGFKLLP